MQPAIAMNNAPSEFWMECSICNTFLNTYKPQEHQFQFHTDGHRFKGNFGGYGSGKTLTSRQEIYKHIFLTPNGNTIIGANVASQYEQTIKREFEADFPKAFVQNISTQKGYVDFINGHRIIYRPFDDPEKLRSYNVTMFVIVEASEVKEASFTQLKTRLRNLASTKPKRNKKGEICYKLAKNGVKIPIIEFDWSKGIIESNPDAGWIKNQVLNVSDDIQKHGTIFDTYMVLADERDPAISSHVTSTDANEFLPPGFIDNNKKNKPLWWINRYLYGSFLYSEGLVYPGAMNCVSTTFEIPKHWKRIIGYDYGLVDDSVFLFGTVDEEHNLLYIYKEVRTKDRSVEELAKLFHQETKDIPIGGMICPPIIDPKSGPKRDYDKKTLSDHFLDYGISFKAGHINVDARIYRLNTYISSSKLRIMDCCVGLIKEIKEYKFLSKESEQSGWIGKPEDKNNHGINALEWIVMELPANPKNLLYGVYNKAGELIPESTEEDDNDKYKLWALSDPEPGYDRSTPFDMVDYNY